MAHKEVFQTPCWSFIGGDRQIERLLRELPAGQRLVVRNRLANVLPTVANMADLARMRGHEPLKLSISVPENAVDERAIALDAPASGAFYETLLSRLYGVTTGDVPESGPETLVLAVGLGPERDAEAARLAAWLAAHPDVQIVFLLPAGASLHPALRPFKPFSAQYWEGLGAFSSPAIEEAVEEAGIERVVVAGGPAASVAYSAIGAVDMFIRRETAEMGRPPANPRGLGGRVSVLRGATDPGPQASGTWREAIRRHMEEELGACSTEADARFRLTAEAIAIDIV